MITDLLAAAALFGFIIVLLSLLGGLTSDLLRNKDQRLPRLVLPGGDQNTLHYCDGCGCRHRRANMGWTRSGSFRCTACCLHRTVMSGDVPFLDDDERDLR